MYSTSPLVLWCDHATYVSSDAGLFILKVVLQLFNSEERVVAKLVGTVSEPYQLEVKDRALRPFGGEDRENKTNSTQSIIQYTNNHQHPYIDSTIVLSDKGSDKLQ